MNLFRTKSIAEMRKAATHSGMAKTLGAFDLILLGIGAVIGTGIFVLTGVRRACRHDILHLFRACLCTCRACLCGICLRRSGVRQCVHLYIRIAWRVHRVHRRLEFGS